MHMSVYMHVKNIIWVLKKLKGFLKSELLNLPKLTLAFAEVQKILHYFYFHCLLTFFLILEIKNKRMLIEEHKILHNFISYS